MSVASQEPIYFRDRNAWRKWLERNHGRKSEIWILAFKRHVGKRSVSYEEALEEAICYGWIDSRMRRIDDERHTWRFVPRRPDSIWSLGNRGRAERLIREGRMTPAGLETIKAARKSGKWAMAYAPSRPPRMPKDLKEALMQNTKAWTNFQAFAKSYRTTYLYWIASAKRDETRRKRIQEVVRRAEKNLKMYVPDDSP